MANVERSQNHEGQNVVEMLALFLTGKIRGEDLSENNQAILGYYLGVMDDDPDFAAQVYSKKNQLITDGKKIPLYPPNEINEKKSRLRNRIGLPVARGRDSHDNDIFYKFLIRRVYTYDAFEIFREYDRVSDIVPPELDLKIRQVGGFVDELLNKNLSRPQRFREFNQFAQEYRDRWNIPK